MTHPLLRQALLVLGLMLSVWCVRAAPGQDQPGGVTGDVELRVTRFGAGDASRQGEWVGVLVEVADRGLEQREIILRIEGQDPDGDRPVFDRAVTSNPGSPQSFWLYTRLGWSFDPNMFLTVSAWPKSGEDRDREGALAFEVGARPLARIQVNTSGVIDKSHGMIGVLGSSTMGLRGYDQSRRGVGGDNHIVGHELTRIVGLELPDVPDRAQGLMQFEALVWGGTRSPDPLRLSPEQARAIRAWVAWGGHLVIVLPSIGQEWFARSNPLFELLPDALPGEQVGGVDLEAFRPLLSKTPIGVRPVPLPDDASVRYLDPNPGAAPGDAVRVIESPEGRTVVVSRVQGAGAVTLVGLDLGDPKLNASGLPEADQFWNRVLGRRIDLDESTPVWDKAKGAQRTPVSFDSDIPGEIAKSGRAYIGVLLGIVVFALYWVIAGPGGYAVLGKLKQKRHAWVAFVAAVGVFTAIAWTGATAIRPRRVEAVHLTMLHQVHGQPTQRARTWASVLIPSYGDATISVGDDDERGSGSRVELISPWEPPIAELFNQASFPDNREYRVDARRPDALRAPTRSTVKQVRVDWVGDARWLMPEPVAAAGEVGGARLWVDETHRVHGSLKHALPGPLDDVVVIVVSHPNPVSGAMRNRLPFNAYAYSIPKVWEPGQSWDLFEETKDTTPTVAWFEGSYDERILSYGKPIISELGRSSAGSALDRLIALQLFPMLPPPTFERGGSGDRLARRAETHGLDLGLWFTRPCVIVLGVVDNPEGAQAPVPLRVNGRPTPVSGGRTLVSWVYPLPDNPAGGRDAEENEPVGDDPAADG